MCVNLIFLLPSALVCKGARNVNITILRLGIKLRLRSENPARFGWNLVIPADRWNRQIPAESAGLPLDFTERIIFWLGFK
jgi:hypothetical protein